MLVRANSSKFEGLGKMPKPKHTHARMQRMIILAFFLTHMHLTHMQKMKSAFCMMQALFTRKVKPTLIKKTDSNHTPN
jgi:hypothetical protein